MNSFTESNLSGLRKEIDEALKKVADKNDIYLNTGNISYSNNEFKTKLTATIKDANTTGDPDHDKYARDWELVGKFQYDGDIEVGAKLNHLKLGKITLLGWDRKSRKYPIMVEQSSTKECFKLSVESFKAILEAQNII